MGSKMIKDYRKSHNWNIDSQAGVRTRMSKLQPRLAVHSAMLRIWSVSQLLKFSFKDGQAKHMRKDELKIQDLQNTMASCTREGELNKGNSGSLTDFSFSAHILLSWQGSLEQTSVIKETFLSALQMYSCAKVSFHLYS